MSHVAAILNIYNRVAKICFDNRSYIVNFEIKKISDKISRHRYFKEVNTITNEIKITTRNLNYIHTIHRSTFSAP